MSILHDDRTWLRRCDGCGIEWRIENPRGDRLDQLKAELDAGEPVYCEACTVRRRDDPTILVAGRSLAYSEFERQAESDPELRAAKDGDTVQEQLKAARRARRP